MNLHKYTAIKLARTLANKAGLNVILEEELMPRTDGKTIYIQNPVDSWGENEWAIWWGTLYHEIGHNVPEMRDCFELAKSKEIDMQSFFGAGINLLDDHRQEHFGWDEYAGRRSALSKSQGLAVDRIVTSGNLGAGEDKHRDAIEAMLAWDSYQREEWMMGLTGQADQLYEQLSDQARGWVDALRSSSYVLKDNVTAEDEYNMWKEIQSEIFKFDPEEEEKQAQASYRAKHGEKADGDGEEDDGTGEGNGKGDSESEKKTRTKRAEVNYSDLLKHEHHEHLGDSSYEPLKIHYDTSDDYYTFNSKPVETIDYTTGGGRGRRGGYDHRIGSLVSHAGSLSATVRRLLQIYSRDRYQYGKKKGKLHGRSLYRLGIKDGGGVSERVFKQKKVNQCLDVSFTVLGDASGSMSGSKYANMGASMVMLNEAIQPLGIPYELLAFTDDYASEMSIFKTFNSRTNTEKLIHDLDDCGSKLHQNADGEAILWAYHRLAAQKTKRKVLVVLSDGSPASNRSGSDAHTRNVVKEIEKRGEVEIYGVGIEDDNVSRIYTDWKVIDNSGELESALLDLIKTKIIK